MRIAISVRQYAHDQMGGLENQAAGYPLCYPGWGGGVDVIACWSG